MTVTKQKHFQKIIQHTFSQIDKTFHKTLIQYIFSQIDTTLENVIKRADVCPGRPKPRLHPAIKYFQFFFRFQFLSCRSQLDIRPSDDYCSCQLWYLPSGSSGTGFPGKSSLTIAELESSLPSQQRQGNTTVSPSLFVTVTSSTNMVRPRPYPSSPMRSLVIYK